jgi:hypothetical protein
LRLQRELPNRSYAHFLPNITLTPTRRVRAHA